MKNKIVTILIITATVILAGIAIFTAVRLYQLRNKSISPSAPESEPAAAQSQYTHCSTVALTFVQSTGTPEPTATPGGTATPTPTDEPDDDDDEPEPTATPRLTATPRSTEPPTGGVDETPEPTEEPTLPDAGIPTPTIVGIGAGLLLLIFSLALVL